MTQGNKDQRSLGTLDRSIEVIKAIRDLKGASVTELADYLDYPISTVHSHVSTLQNHALVVNRDGEYHLGVRFISFGEYVRRSNPLYQHGRQIINRLAEETGDLAMCGVEQNGIVTLLHIQSGEKAIDNNSEVGMGTLAHLSAIGKAILAFHPEERVEQIIAKWGLPKVTENSITDYQELMSELEDIREKGVATGDEELFIGMKDIAAPIIVDDTVIGAIGISGPSKRLSEERVQEDLTDRLLSEANTIEIQIAY
jgi:DNA-binding IclR family transcriptional regulator